MAPKITNEMREALHHSHGLPVDIEDEQANAVYVLIDKDTFSHLRTVQGNAEEGMRQHLRSFIEEGIASGDYQPTDTVFGDLRQYAEKLASQQA